MLVAHAHPVFTLVLWRLGMGCGSYKYNILVLVMDTVWYGANPEHKPSLIQGRTSFASQMNNHLTVTDNMCFL